MLTKGLKPEALFPRATAVNHRSKARKKRQRDAASGKHQSSRKRPKKRHELSDDQKTPAATSVCHQSPSKTSLKATAAHLTNQQHGIVQCAISRVFSNAQLRKRIARLSRAKKSVLLSIAAHLDAWHPAARALKPGTGIKAAEVFAVPELLAEILERLDFYDLLVNCNRVNRSFRKGIVSGSPRLRRILHLEPDLDCQPRTIPRLPKHLKFVAIDIDDYELEFPGKNFETADGIFVFRDEADTQDASWRKMLLVQGSPLKVGYIFRSHNEWLETGELLTVHGAVQKSEWCESADHEWVHEEAHEKAPECLGMMEIATEKVKVSA